MLASDLLVAEAEGFEEQDAKRQRVDDGRIEERADAGGASAAAPPMECGACGKHPTDVPWGRYGSRGKGATVTRMAVGDACRRCVVSAVVGRWGLTWAECKAKCNDPKDVDFRPKFWAAGDVAMRKGLTGTLPPFLAQEVSDEVVTTIVLKRDAELVGPEEFKQEQGVSHTFVGLSITSIGGQAGILVQGAGPPKVKIYESHALTLQTKHLNASDQVRDGQGVHMLPNVRSEAKMSVYTDSDITSKVAAKIAEDAAAAAAAADGDLAVMGEDFVEEDGGIDLGTLGTDSDETPGPAGRRKAARSKESSRRTGVSASGKAVGSGSGGGRAARGGGRGGRSSKTLLDGMTTQTEARLGRREAEDLDSCAVFDAKSAAAGSDYNKHIAQLSQLGYILEGRAPKIGQQIYQAERLKRSLSEKSSVPNTAICAKLKRATENEAHAKELVPNRIPLLTASALKARVRWTGLQHEQGPARGPPFLGPTFSCAPVPRL